MYIIENEGENITVILDFSTKICYIYNDKVLLNNFKEEKVMQVTKNSIIGDILDYDRGTAQFFFEIGMHCLGCPASRGESIEEACAVHGTNAEELVKKINDYLAKQ